MFGLLIIIAIYAVLGFMYAWIAGVVAREDVDVKAGVLVVVMPAIAGIALSLADLGPLIDLGLSIGLNFVLLTLGGRFFARLGWKHAAIIAAIYIMLLVVLGVLFALVF